VLLLVGIVASTVWLRIIVHYLAFSPELRKSCQLTPKIGATCAGIVAFVGMLLGVVLKEDGNILAAPAMFSWHPLAMIAATAVLNPAAVDFVTMRFASKNPAERKNLVVMHAALQFGAVICVVLGFASIYYNKPPGKHFLSLHSLVGLAAMGSMAANLLYAQAKSLRFLRLPKLSWTDGVHRALGSISFFLCILASALGLYNKVMLLPEGWDGPWASASMEWLKPGGTWAYSVIGTGGAYITLTLLFWVVFFMLSPNPKSRHGSKKKATFGSMEMDIDESLKTEHKKVR